MFEETTVTLAMPEESSRFRFEDDDKVVDGEGKAFVFGGDPGCDDGVSVAEIDDVGVVL